MEPIGLGDIVAQFASSIGITPTPGCKCEKRKQTLNKWFPRVALQKVQQNVASNEIAYRVPVEVPDGIHQETMGN